MKKIVLSLVLIFGILFIGNVFAQYEYFESKGLTHTNYVYKSVIKNKECTEYNLGKDLIKICNKREIYINGNMLKDHIPKTGITSHGIFGVILKGDELYIDFYYSNFIYGTNTYTRYVYKDILTREELINENIKIKKYFKGSKYLSKIDRINEILEKTDTKKLKKINVSISKIKFKYSKNRDIFQILNYIENKIKIILGDYIYEYIFNEDDLKLNIKNDINNKKILFGEVTNKDIEYVRVDGFSGAFFMELEGGKWEFNTNETYTNKYYNISYLDKNTDTIYSEKINSGKNIENNFKLNIKNNEEYFKILSGEVLDENVKSIKIGYRGINVENFNGGKWEQNSGYKSGKMYYDVFYYDKNGKLYYNQKIYID